MSQQPFLVVIGYCITGRCEVDIGLAHLGDQLINTDTQDFCQLCNGNLGHINLLL